MLFILVSAMVCAIDLHILSPGSLKNNYDFNNRHKWDDQIKIGANAKFNVHSLWTPSDSGSYSNMDFSKDFWLPIEPWEYEVCRYGLSTQLTPQKNQAGIGGSVYNTTITVTASQFYAPGNNSYLYEVSWYVHPSGETGGYYTINLIGSGIDDIFIQKTGAGQRRGSQGYNAFYSSKNYTKVKLTYEGTTYPFEIVPTLDKNRLKKG